MTQAQHTPTRPTGAPCYTVSPWTGGAGRPMDEAEFKDAFIISSCDLGDGHFRYMATLDRRLVNIVQVPSAVADALMTTPEAEAPIIPTSGRDRIAASLSGKQMKPAVAKLSGQQKIAAALTTQAASEGKE